MKEWQPTYFANSSRSVAKDSEMKIFSFNKLHSNEQLFKIQNMGIFLFHLPVVVGAGGWGGGGGEEGKGL